MKKMKFPTPYTILVIVMCLAAALTYLLPAGGYDTLQYDKDKNVFVIQSADTLYQVPATQQALSERSISIELSKFTDQKIKNPISIPNTYKQRKATPQGFVEILFAPIKGIYEAVSLILFVLFIGGFIGVFNSSGALNEGVGYLAHRFKGKEGILIIVLATLMALGGTSFGLAEETLAFYPMLVPIFLAAGYDLLVPLAVIFIGANVGTLASTSNPFAVIIASDAAGVDWTSGLTIRAIALVLCLTISIIYITYYAEKVKKHPEKSLVYGVELPEIYTSNIAKGTTELKLSTKIQLLVFALTFVVMIIGVSQWKWWFQEMTGLFLASAVIIAILQRSGEKKFVEQFLAGARDLLGVAFIIGIARGVSFILNEGQISGTILYYATELVKGMSPMVFLPIVMLILGVLSLFIASSSGMAVLTMPIMGALATAVGIEGDKVVSAYLFGIGIMSLITPTGVTLPSLAMVNVNYNQWLKFCWPLIAIFTVVLTVLLWV
ncbi:YfcC family protein [Capnocytophaga sp. oral taxon 338]|uniref:YfcC family protein n=1 Tax=Capnocytophaga sp. oral taxon 338 TaxID=710239 RepID=UPI0002F18015|nr:YfcC family protein [Capnocytophaga sp. oral taxon 338]